jgi:ankyrin repeat protein
MSKSSEDKSALIEPTSAASISELTLSCSGASASAAAAPVKPARVKHGIDRKNSDGDTALHLALKHDLPDYIKRIMPLGPRVDIPDSEGKTCLDLALTPERYDISMSGKIFLKLYIARPNFDPNAIINSAKRETLLHALVKFSNTRDIIGELVFKGAKIDAQDSDGKTVLDIARAHARYIEILDFSSIDNLLPSGDTRLHEALKRGDDLMVKLLMKNSARVDIQNSEHKTALDLLWELSIKQPIDLKVGASRDQLLRDCAARPGGLDVKLSSGDTLLHTAFKKGYPNLAIYLLENGANRGLTDAEGYSIAELSEIDPVAQEVMEVVISKLCPPPESAALPLADADASASSSASSSARSIDPAGDSDHHHDEYFG